MKATIRTLAIALLMILAFTSIVSADIEYYSGHKTKYKGFVYPPDEKLVSSSYGHASLTSSSPTPINFHGEIWVEAYVGTGKISLSSIVYYIWLGGGTKTLTYTSSKPAETWVNFKIGNISPAEYTVGGTVNAD